MDRLDPTALGTLLSVWAHPDDEAYLAGGLMAALRDAGHRVVCVTATRGESADPSSTPGERAALGAVRTRELRGCLDTLGVSEHHWLGHPDGGCAEVDADLVAARLACLVDDICPDTVVTFGPDGVTGHPDHRTVSRWVDLALGRAGTRPRLLHPVQHGPAPDPALDEEFDIYALGGPRAVGDEELVVRLDLAGAALERKVEALLRQESQTAALAAAVGPERYRRWVATESFAYPAGAVPRG